MGFMEETEAKSLNIKEKDGSEVYEVGYLLVPTISEENVPEKYGNLKELVVSLSGEVISDEMPRMMALAYPMAKVISNVRNKFTNAYFGWIKFTIGREQITEIKKKLDLDPNIVRFLILKTVRENTIAGKRFMRTDVHRRPRVEKKEEGEAAPINKEEIDKEIDALVAAE
jgi:ribosomal protein S6